MSRPTIDKYFMDMAELVSQRATCDRRHVGCVITRNNRVLTTGYNGSMPGEPHCDDVGHLHIGSAPNCHRTVHAEMNAVCQAAKYGISLAGATAYITCSPCAVCVKLLISAGIERIVTEEVYDQTICEQYSIIEVLS